MRYFLQRFGQLLIVFLIVTFGVMVVMRIGSENPTQMGYKLLGGSPSPAEVAKAVKQYHLDQNYPVQYFHWIKGLVVDFDLGYSKTNNKTVADLVKPRVWTTVLLGLYANVFGLIVAVPLAVRQAHKRDSLFDKSANLLTFVGVGIPAVVLGIFLQLLFVVRLGWFPSIGLAGRHSIIVIEHDMVFVRKIARTVTVLHQGSVLCEGTVDQVQADERVMEVYLGRKKKA